MPDDATRRGRSQDPSQEPLLDRLFLDGQTFGDADLAEELLRLFQAQCDRLVPQIADAAQAPGARMDAAHTLRGAAQAIGARRVACLAARIEAALAERAEAADTGALTEALAQAARETAAAAA